MELTSDAVEYRSPATDTLPRAERADEHPMTGPTP